MTTEDNADQRQKGREMPTTDAQNTWRSIRQQVAHLGPSMSMPRTRQYGAVYANQAVEFEVNNAIGTLLTIVVRDVPDATVRKALVEQLEEVRFSVQEAVL